jgi:hypothetical protein
MIRAMLVIAFLFSSKAVQAQADGKKAPFDPWENRPKPVPFICEAEGNCLHTKGRFNRNLGLANRDLPAQDYRFPTKIKWYGSSE